MQITLKDIADILLVAIVLFGFYRILRRSGASNLFWGILIFVLAWFVVSEILHLELMGALFDRIISVGALALIVIFQDELRGFMYRLGSRIQFRGIRYFFSGRYTKGYDRYIDEICTSCVNMQASHTGALIVIEGAVSLDEYADTGEKLDAEVSARLIENIFFKNSPLHDGALILTRNRLRAGACILPVSKDTSIPQHYGLRHRAALGIAEKTDAMAIVVSEETGNMSVARNGEIHETNPENLKKEILSFVHL